MNIEEKLYLSGQRLELDISICISKNTRKSINMLPYPAIKRGTSQEHRDKFIYLLANKRETTHMAHEYTYTIDTKSQKQILVQEKKRYNKSLIEY